MRKEPKEERKNERQYWLWVTGPNYYLDEEGNERPDLDPSGGIEDLWGSWTCSKDTKIGDLALLWRSRRNIREVLGPGAKVKISLKSDIGYLFQAESDAYTNDDKEEIISRGWNYGCEMVPIYKFKNPLSISEIRRNPYLQDWNALRGKFQHSYFKISLEDWERLSKLLVGKNPDYEKLLDKVQRTRIPVKVFLEEQIEEKLVQNLGLFKRLGFNLKLFEDSAKGLIGRQLVCVGGEGRIDLLCYDKQKKTYVVIELKNVRAGINTFGQISNYIGWVKETIAHRNSVKGLVISRGADTAFLSALKTNPNIFQTNIEELGFK